MQPRDMQLFLHLCQTLHFGQTSRHFHISPSSLTRLIQRLEGEVGVPLFERDNRTVKLTGAGQRFRLYAIDVLERWSRLKRELQQSEVLSGQISIFCSVTASYSFLHELLAQFRARYPAVEIQLHTGDSAHAVQRVLDEQEDVSIAAQPDHLPDKLSFRSVSHSPLVFIAPSLPGPVQDLAEAAVPGQLPWESVPMILSESGVARSRADQWVRSQGLKPNIYAQVAGNEAIVSMVSLGFGIGVVPLLVLENSPMRTKIRILDVTPALEPFSIGLCALSRRLANPLVQALWDLSQEHVSPDSAGQNP